MPPEISGAVAAFITAVSTALLWYASYRWGPNHHDDDDDDRGAAA